MRERSVEAYFTKRVRELGGASVKHTSPGTNGEPDQLVKLPGCPLAVCEMKRPDEEPTEQQYERLAYWEKHGVIAGWANSHAGVERFFQMVERRSRG